MSGEHEERRHGNRRGNECAGICEDEREAIIKEAAAKAREDIERDFYANIGKTIVRKTIWITITTATAFIAWAKSKSIF